MAVPVPGVTDETLRQRWRTLFVVCVAIPEVVLLLWFVILYIRRHAEEPRDVGFLLPLFALAALAALGVAPLLRRLLLPRPGYRPADARLSLEEAAIGAVTAAYLAGYAVCELSVLLGFVLAFLGAPLWVFAGFTAVTLVGYALNFPSRPRWEASIAEALAPAEAAPPPSIGPSAF